MIVACLTGRQMVLEVGGQGEEIQRHTDRDLVTACLTELYPLPEGEDAQLLHDVKFASLVEVQDVGEQARIPVKVKLLLLHVIVITYLQEGGGTKDRGKKGKWEQRRDTRSKGG